LVITSRSFLLFTQHAVQKGSRTVTGGKRKASREMVTMVAIARHSQPIMMTATPARSDR
jgi:hypothetical protein